MTESTAGPTAAGPTGSGPTGAGPTGNGVDGVVERLDDLDDLDVDEHPAVFDELHRALSEVLQVGEGGRPGGDQD